VFPLETLFEIGIPPAGRLDCAEEAELFGPVARHGRERILTRTAKNLPPT
jgi:hypothetical protein